MDEAATPEPLGAGERFGRFQLDSLLGEGGVAHVFRAEVLEPRDDEPQSVAIKVLKPGAAENPQILASFQYEMRVLSRLRHPGILRVYETDSLEGHVYSAIELIDDVTLEGRLEAERKLDEPTTLDLGTQVADALGYLHEQGYVHRDVKPGNILLASGRAVLSDFGTVIRAADGVEYETGVFGTPSFLAPEQIRRGEHPIDGRSDVYALGIVLYLMITGKRPFYGSREDVLEAHLSVEPAAPSSLVRMSVGLDGIICRALLKQAEERFASGAESAAALRTVEPLPPRPSLAKRLTGWLRGGSNG